MMGAGKTLFWGRKRKTERKKKEGVLQDQGCEAVVHWDSTWSVSVSPPMATLRAAALVECSHRLISRSGLYLHEISPRVLTLRTGFCSGIHILPGSWTPKNIIHLFQFGILSVVDLPCNIVNIRACVAGESVTSLTLFYDQHISTCWAEQEHFLPVIQRTRPADKRVLFLSNSVIK